MAWRVLRTPTLRANRLNLSNSRTCGRGVLRFFVGIGFSSPSSLTEVNSHARRVPVTHAPRASLSGVDEIEPRPLVGGLVFEVVDLFFEPVTAILVLRLVVEFGELLAYLTDVLGVRV